MSTREVVTGDVANRAGSGEVLSAAGWLNDHFEACAEYYARMVKAAGLQPGWTVLDAGGGAGDFLPLLAEQVGERGHLLAVDHDPSNVRIAATRATASSVLGSVTALPLRTGAVDAAWCANVTQYFDDASLMPLLRELMRVVRPGGSVAVKDVDMTGLRIHPADPLLGARLADACASVPPVAPESIGSLRGRTLRRWLERAGLEDVTQQTFTIEYWAPLDPPARRLWTAWLPFLASLAEEHRVPDADLETWRKLRDPEHAAAFVDRPDFYACELQVVAVGRVPEGASP